MYMFWKKSVGGNMTKRMRKGANKWFFAFKIFKKIY